MKKQLSKRDQKLSDCEVLGQAFWNLIGHYKFNRKQQAGLLGIPDYRQRLNSLNNKKEIPNDPDKMNRVGMLLGIHKNLRILFPHNREIVYGWMSHPQSVLGGVVPIEFILEDPIYSYERLAIVRRRLDYIRCAG